MSSLSGRIAREGLRLRTGPFVFHVTSSIPAVAAGVELLYPGREAAPDDGYADFRVEVETPRGPRRWYRPQARFRCDGAEPFKPLPLGQALPFLEWGMNWTIAEHAHQYLIIHAAAIERGGRVAILPGASGSGKSTLTAALAHRGWRLLTDELTLVSREDARIVPLARPVSLKNESIEVIRRFAGATLSAPAPDTAKGTVALMRPPAESVARAHEPAAAAWIVFPQFRKDAPAALEPKGKAATFIDLAVNAFNYHVHGQRGFELLAGIVDRSRCLAFTYGHLDEAVAAFARLADETAG